jgi:hypothetical protein
MNQTITTGPGFHFANIWEEPCSPDSSAASPAGAGGTIGGSTTCGTQSQNDTVSVNIAGSASTAKAPSSTPDHPAGDVPIWINVIDDPGDLRWRCGEAILRGILALRADRDGWQTQAELVTRTLDDAHARIATLEADRDVWRKRAEDTARDEANALDRVRELEAAQARQMATIDRLTNLALAAVEGEVASGTPRTD